MKTNHSPALFLIVFVIGLAAYGFAEDKNDIMGFERTAFDAAFSRADRETNVDKWMEEARRGVSLAMAAWERIATALYSDEAVRSEAGRSLAAWTEEELEARFASWLRDQFFGAEGSRLRTQLATTAAEANRKYLYLSDAEGNIRYDAGTGDPLVIRPNEDGTDTTEVDRASWKAMTTAARNALLGGEAARMENLRPELLAYVSQDRRTAFSALLQDAMDASYGRAERELNGIVSQEERLFVARRIGDVWSLRNKSEGEAASAIAARLAAETTSNCDEDIRSLETRIEAASAGTGDLALAGSEWLDQYREQFSRGLSAWEEAEERFMVRRLEWEREAAKNFSEGDAAWAAAFEKLETERKNWEAKAQRLLEAGENVFSRSSEELERNIADAKAELDRDAALRSQTSAERARAWVDSYITCASVVTGARESMNFWVERLTTTSGLPGLGNPALYGWLDARENEARSWGNANALTATQEARKWASLYDTYLAKATEARNALVEDFGLAIGTGALQDVLGEGVSSEDFHLDEYQIELIRAKAVAGYWAKRVGIAEAVNEYAQAVGAGRATDAESLAAWQDAKADYDAAIVAYQSAQEKLSIAGEGVSTARQEVNAAAAVLAQADAALEQLNEQYSLQMSVIAAGGPEFVEEDLARRYGDLLEQRGLLSGTDASSLLGKYLERARALGHAENLESSAQALDEYVRGATGETSLAKLSEAFHAISVPANEATANAATATSDISSLGLADSDPSYAAVRALAQARDEALAYAVDSGASEDEIGEIEAGWGLLIRSAVQDAAKRAEAALEARMDAIAALAANDAASWYADRADAALGADELETRLRSDAETARRSVLRGRTELELEAVRYLLGHVPNASPAAQSLAGVSSLTADEAAAVENALQALLSVLDGAGGKSNADYQAAIAALGSTNAMALAFAQGNSFFVLDSGVDPSAYLLAAFFDDQRRAEGRLDAYYKTSENSIAFDRLRREASWNKIRTALSTAGVSLPATGLPPAKSIGAVLAASSNFSYDRTAAFLVAVDEARRAVPSWIADEIGTWREAVLEYAVSRAYAFGVARPDAAAYATAATTSSARSSSLASAVDAISSSGGDSARGLCSALSLDASDLAPVGAAAIFEEASRRIARSLLLAVDEDLAADELEPALRAAGVDHDYATETVLDRAIALALGAAQSGAGAASFVPVTSIDSALFASLSSSADAALDETALASALSDCASGLSAAYDAAAGNPHWRTYLDDGVVVQDRDGNGTPDYAFAASGDPEGGGNLARAAANWAEGARADAYERAERLTATLSISFDSWALMEDERTGGGAASALAAFRADARRYLADASATPDDIDDRLVSASVRDAADAAYASLRQADAGVSALAREIANLGQTLAASSGGSAAQAAVAAELSSRILLLRADYDEAMTAYADRASAYADAGAQYDAAYAATKDSYGTYERSRNEYEKWDAVRRWAATSYLAADEGSSLAYRSPTAELAYAKDQRAKADVALTALKTLYDSDDAKRPYADTAYTALYATYQERFSLMLLAAKARDNLALAINKERAVNEKLHNSFVDSLSGNIAKSIPYNGYTPQTGKDVDWKSVLRVSGGHLSLAYGGGYALSVASVDDAAALNSYFTTDTTVGAEIKPSTDFQRELGAWASRMATYNLSSKLESWGLARDYLVSKLVAANTQYTSLASGYNLAQTLYDNIGGEDVCGMEIKDFLKGYRSTKGYTPGYWTEYIHHDMWEEEIQVPINRWSGQTFSLITEQTKAWNKLTTQQKADLEYFIALQVSGALADNVLANAFSTVSELHETRLIDMFIEEEEEDHDNDWWGDPCYKYWDFRHMEKTYQGHLDDLEAWLTTARSSFATSLSSVAGTYNAYKASTDRLAVLEGAVSAGSTATWTTVRASLAAAGGLSAGELAQLGAQYTTYTSAASASDKLDSSDVALDGYASWASNLRKDSLTTLEAAWAEDETVRAQAETAYRATYDRFIVGQASETELRDAARAAYGTVTASRKTHLMNLESGIRTAALSGTVGFSSEYSNLLDEYASLISRASRSRIEAEESARVAEWDQMRLDLQEKANSWQTAAGLILERGSADWEKGAAKMQEARVAWAEKYRNQYEETEAVWNAAWLQSMNEKQEWADRATEAANQASGAAILALVGNDAEAGARRMDARGAYGIPSSGSEEVASAMKDVLSRAGIVNLASAFSGASGSAATVATAVRRGLGGSNTWDGARLAVAAAAFTRNANAELAGRQARIIATQARESVEGAAKGLAKNVDEANQGFEDSMDNVFMMEGKWQRTDSGYRKEVVVHSTLLNPYILETAKVPGYIAYVMSSWSVKTDLSDDRLQTLDERGVMALVGLAQKEVEAQATKVFGEDGSDGEFTTHVGESPEADEEPNLDDDIEDAFKLQGSGELGRLMRSYIYWSMKEAQGWQAVHASPWSKPIWDSRGSWFQAPSIRSYIDISATIIAAIATAPMGGVGALAVSAAINLADDAVFTMMDVAGGYSSWEDAGMAFGKKALTTVATSAIGAGFNGASGSANNFLNSGGISGLFGNAGKTVIGKTLLAGAQSYTTSTVTSAISAISFDGDWSWDKRAFADGMKASNMTALSGMASTFTSGVLNRGLEGFTGKTYANGSTLSNFLGGVAGQGVNYSMGGDMTFNLAKLTMKASNDRMVSTGLLEMHLGRDGMGMNFGTSGVDASMGTIAKSVAGLDAWRVNSQLFFSEQSESHKYTSAMRTLYSGGASERSMYEDILAGRTNIVENASADFNAETVYNSSTGTRTVTLGRDALADGSRFGLNVLFSHESYRNGIDDGIAGQMMETDRAVEGHIKTATSLAETYGGAGLSREMIGEVLAYQASQNGDGQAYRDVLSSYDSSKDYWRMLDNGSLENDGDGWLRDVNNNYILDKDGNRIGAAGAEAGLMKIFNMSDTAENRSIAVTMMKGAGMTEKGAGVWWNHADNIGKTISISDAQYRGLYDAQLAQHNPVNIYNALVASGNMDLNPAYDSNKNSLWYKGLSSIGLGGVADSFAGSKYISYEQYKANNFIQGTPELKSRAPIAEGSEINTLFGASGDRSTYPHRGLDYAVKGLNVYPIFANDTTFAEVFQSDADLLSAQGRHVDLTTDITYTFKGEQRTDQVMQRMLHLGSAAVSGLDMVTIDTLLGVSGNTGSWNGEGYGYHLHTDISANQNRSPWLDQMGRNYASKIMSSYSYSGDNRTYYDPLIFLNQYNYPIQKGAYLYN